ncbi:hypothetical protein D3C81_1941360 [compost metagenome]
MPALLVQRLPFLLRDRPAQQIRFAKREACHQRGNLHDLLLIDNNAIGIIQYLLQIRMRILHFDLAVFACDIFRNKFHRTRTVQRHHRYDILEA